MLGGSCQLSLQDLKLEADQDLVIFILEGNRNAERAHRCFRVGIWVPLNRWILDHYCVTGSVRPVSLQATRQKQDRYL